MSVTESGIVRPETMRDMVGGPPHFSSGEEARKYIKKRIAGVFRIFGARGFGEGVAGHISVRDPERPDHFWVNPFGRAFQVIRPQDLLLVSQDGTVVGGQGIVNGGAFAIHSRIHAARPDVHAVCHMHSRFGMAWSSLGRTLRPITQDACAFFEAHTLFDDYTGLVLDVGEGDRIAKTLGDGRALILRNHGLLTVGATLDEAAWWFLSMERACEVELMARAVAEPVEIAADAARVTRDQVGTPIAGWFGFQPIWEAMLHDNPDLADG
jgi:ribulose-5-phosphate 4-epimerase/fuculose-1-phosphate aldolase